MANRKPVLQSGTLVIAVIVLLTAAFPVAGQTRTGSSFVGVVKDTTGLPLAGVTVEASSPALIEKVRVAVTDDKGQYQIVDLVPGTYNVTFTLPGFAVVSREALQLSSNFTATVNAELKIGSIEETVTVSGQSPTVDVYNVTQQTTLTRTALDALPASKNAVGYAALTAAAVMPQNSMDVGGSKGELSVRISVHGSKQGDMKQLFDGMRYNSMLGTGTNRNFYPNHASVEQVIVETGTGGSAEFSSGGVQLNVVPKDGGNRMSGFLFGNYTDENLQGDNLTDELIARGVVANSSIQDIYDVNGALGGPIKRDRLWFYTAHRHWGDTIRGANLFENSDLDAWTYTPDLNRPSEAVEWFNSNNVRLTWQAAKLHKLSFFWDHQQHCICNSVSGSGALFSGTATTEATNGIRYKPDDLYQVRWTYPASNSLLFTAGFSFFSVKAHYFAQPGVELDSISVQEQSTGLRYRAPVSTRRTAQQQFNQQFSMSYITGSHLFKTGVYMLEGSADSDITPNGDGVSYTFLNGNPTQLTEYRRTITRDVVRPEMGVFVQDQWTLNRLTLNAGLRFEYFRAFAAASVQPAGRFLGEVSFDQVDCAPCWKDFVPRLAAAYNLFGTGKTVIKASINRYVGAQATGLANAVNPVNASVNQTNRSWSDLNRNFIPDCDLRNPEANGNGDLCGRMANTNFGGLNITTRYDPDVLNGWGKRDYNWQASAVVEHELLPGTAVRAGYFRTWYRNFTVTDNLAVGPADFDPYCFTAPVDPRLPVSGQQICGLYNIKPEKFGLVNNLVTFASNYGLQQEVYNGMDFNLDARFGGGAFVSGGVNIGNSNSSGGMTTTSSAKRCFVVDSPQELYQCDTPIPYQVQLKFSGLYPLPLDFQVSAVFQTLPGAPLAASYAVPDSLIIPSLGRPLAGGARTATVSILDPFTQFENRINQLDLRMTKLFRFKQVRVQGMIDLYNALNASPVLQFITTYGPSWLRPTEILGARTIKFGAQLDF